MGSFCYPSLALTACGHHSAAAGVDLLWCQTATDAAEIDRLDAKFLCRRSGLETKYLILHRILIKYRVGVDEAMLSIAAPLGDDQINTLYDTVGKLPTGRVKKTVAALL